MKKRLLIGALTACLTFTYPFTFAAELTGTLKKINDSGTISVGHRESSIPFSYYDNDQNVVGYSHEISLKIVEAVKKELKRDIRVRLTPITSQNRIPLMRNGTIDIECGSTTHNLARAKEVGFTNTFFIINIRFITNKDSGLHEFEDLAGKTVITTAGTTPERVIRTMNDEKKMNMRIVSAKDHGDAFLMVTDGRGAAFVMDDPLLYGERAKAPNPAQWVVTGASQGEEAYACMIRKDDPQFKALADKVIADMSRSGELEKLYNKWFTQPIPPNNTNLDFPLSGGMKELFKDPTDKPYQ